MQQMRLDVGPVELTPRQYEVLVLLCDGLSNDEIGKRMFLSEKTIKAHLSEMTRKLGSRNRTHMAVQALRLGIVPLHQPLEVVEVVGGRE